MVLPLTSKNEIIFIKKYCAAEDSYELVLPGGKIENGLSLLVTARKELREEIGMAAATLIPLGDFKILPSYLVGKTYGFIAKGLKDIDDVKIDNEETLKIVKLKMKNVLEKIKNKEIRDSRTVAVILYVTTFFPNL